MRIFIIIHNFLNKKTGHLTLSGKRKIVDAYNMINAKIPAEDNIKLWSSWEPYIQESGVIFGEKLCVDLEIFTDPIKEFKKTRISGFQHKDIQAVIIITNQNIESLLWFLNKESNITKQKFDLCDGTLISIKIEEKYIPQKKFAHSLN